MDTTCPAAVGTPDALTTTVAPPQPSWWVLATAAVLLAAGWHQHFVWLWEKGWHNEYYGHGPLIPLIAAYLIYRRRAEMAAASREGFAAGLPLMVLGLALHLVAIIKDVNFPQGFALVTVIIGLVIWLWGWPATRVILFPLVFLLFMVPMGRLLEDTFAQPMQLWGARIAAGGAAFLGMPVVREGTALHLPNYRLEVAIPCSGLKSAIAMTALGALYAYVLVAPMGKRLLIFAMSLPAALVGNAARLGLTLVMAQSLGPSAAEGFFHSLSGMFVFLIALLALFGFGSLIGCAQIRDDI
jgi:exosortase